MANSFRIGFLGAGKMATALAIGFGKASLGQDLQITAADVSNASREAFTRATGYPCGDSNRDVTANADVLVLAVKPQVMGQVLDEVSQDIDANHLVISIAAGIPLKFLAEKIGPERRTVRVMPNTPALVGAGAAAFACGPAATSEDAHLVEQLFKTVGTCQQVSESLLDAVTGLSGSGPAYVFQIIEALSDGGVRVGLPRAVATQLAAQTVLGAAKMVLETGEHPGPLKDAVTSPGGTTIAGLHELELGGLRGTLINAVVAATERSKELGG